MTMAKNVQVSVTYEIQTRVSEQKTKPVWDFQSTDWENFITRLRGKLGIQISDDDVDDVNGHVTSI